VLKERASNQRPEARLGHSLFVAEMLETGGLRALHGSAESFGKSKTPGVIRKQQQAKYKKRNKVIMRGR